MHLGRVREWRPVIWMNRYRFLRRGRVVYWILFFVQAHNSRMHVDPGQLAWSSLREFSSHSLSPRTRPQSPRVILDVTAPPSRPQEARQYA